MAYPGLSMAEEQAKATAADDVPFVQHGVIDASRISRGELADAMGKLGKTLPPPSMNDLVRANEAVLVALGGQVMQLESTHDRILGPTKAALVAGSQSVKGDTVAAQLWRQNTELAELVSRLQRAVARLNEFA